MARTYHVPNSGSVFTSSACVVGSENKMAWLGFSAPITSSGCVVFYRAGASTSGSEILTIIASPGQSEIMPTPFNSPSGIYVRVSGGSAVVWLEQ